MTQNPIVSQSAKPFELHFTRTNGAVDCSIDELMNQVGGVQHPEIVREMILAALKAGQENSGRADLKMMNASLKEMRFTAKVFSPYRSTRKVSIFGSARTRPKEPAYDMARALGQRLMEAGYMVITGAGGGIMQAVNEGAGSEHSFGVNIRLPFEQKANYILQGHPRNISYKYFFTRKVAFLREADAVVIFPGGFGSLDEAMETLTLVQTGKRNPLPLILLDVPGGTYWSNWIQFLERELLAPGYISPTDLDIFEKVERVEDAVAIIDRFYFRYHSLRYVGERLVIRLFSSLKPGRLKDLKYEFSGILRPDGDLVLSGPLPEEVDEPAIAHLPRLVMDFNRREFGGLKKFIDALNEG
jgi:uncharacterized protein (TIGR00730 family)